MSHRLQQLCRNVEDSRSGVIDAHRALLDSTDSSVGRVCSQKPTFLCLLVLGHIHARLPATCKQLLTSPLPCGSNKDSSCCGLPETMPQKLHLLLLPSLSSKMLSSK